jgi:ribonuclease HII
MTRVDPTLEYEKQLWAQGARIVAGVDEAGRGAWAGPVFAAAVVLPTDERVCALLHGVRDSKQMTARQRERWQDCIKSAAVAWAVSSASNQEIDEFGILPATCLAMQRAVRALRNPPQHLLVDYVHIPGCGEPQTSLPKGDCLCLSIAAASVLAKTARDAFMRALDAEYPGYGFAAHKGYGTARHHQALLELGANAVHRKSFKPVAFLIN